MSMLDELHAKFKALTPKERNEKLQALYSAIAEERGTNGRIDLMTLELLKTLAKSFDISIRFEKLEDPEPEDAF